jgi:maltooligosyltrehalose trehalohydrolase
MARGVDGAVLGPHAFLLRFFGQQAGERLLLVNMGGDLQLDPAPEPLLAPPEGCVWRLLWSTEAPCYGGCGTVPVESDENWRIPGHAAVALTAIAPDRKLSVASDVEKHDARK